MKIKTTAEAFMISIVLASTGTDKAKVKECEKMAELFASQMPKKEVDLCLKAVQCTLEYAKTYKLNN